MKDHLESREIERVKTKKRILSVLSATEGPRQMAINPFEDKRGVCVITMNPKADSAFIYLLGSFVRQKHKTKVPGGY